jgi:hypothetical protein
MATVKCPHCGAGNQDASETDRCWQCENVLGQPATRPVNAPMAANPIVAPTQQLSPDAAPKMPMARSTASAQRTNTFILLFGVLAFAVILVLLLVLLTRR